MANDPSFFLRSIGDDDTFVIFNNFNNGVIEWCVLDGQVILEYFLEYLMLSGRNNCNEYFMGIGLTINVKTKQVMFPVYYWGK